MIAAITGGLIALYLYAIKPANPKKKNLEAFMDRYYAHRGLFDNGSDAPENSINAFGRAIEGGYGIELDVRLTKDNVHVVFHDDTLKRAAGLDKKVSQLDFRELEDINLFNSREKIPTLEDVLQLVDGRVPLIVELKQNQNGDTRICDLVAPLLDSYRGKFMVESFNPILMLWYKKNRPHIIRGQLSTNHIKESDKSLPLSLALGFLLFNFLVKPDFIAYDYKYRNNPSLILNKSLYKITTAAYTLKSQLDLDRQRNLFDIYIFDGFIPEKNN